MKKLIFSLVLLTTLIFFAQTSQAGSFSISFGSGWDDGYRSVYYRPAYYYDRCAPAVVYRPVTYYRPAYYRPYYAGSSYRQGFYDGYSTAVRRAVPVYRAERCDRIYR